MNLAFNYGLYLLETELTTDGTKTMTDIGLHPPQTDWNALLGNRFLLEHRSYDPNEELQLLLTCLGKLNAEQTHVFNTILDCVLEKHPQIFFLEGAAGAGKTFLYIALCHALRS
jgi:hypothetical protein